MNKLQNIYKVQKGDTVVEVMISLLLLSAAFTGCYAIINRSTRNLEAAQLRSQAVKIVSSQIEALRSYYISNGSIPAGLTCFYLKQVAAPPNPPNLKENISTPCYLNSSGSLVAASITPNYSITITSSGSPTTYTVKATWPYNSTTNNVSMVYRVQ